MTIVARFTVCVVVVSAAGCGRSAIDVAGKVDFQSRPVSYGNVILIGPDGIPRYGPIHRDGSYQVLGVPVGLNRVAISSPPPPGAEPPPDRDAKVIDEGKRPPGYVPPPIDQDLVKKWFQIPSKYGDPDKSGLSVEVQSGGPYDFDLK